MSRRAKWLVRLCLLLNLLGLLMLFMSLAMIPSLLLALWDHSADVEGLSTAVGFTFGVGALLFAVFRPLVRGVTIGHREGFLITGMGWLAAGIVGALPFWFYAHLAPDGICDGPPVVGSDFCSFTNAAFESISGFTTTGASIITDGLWGSPGFTPDGRVGLPRGIMFWRFVTHYLGGMGIIVLGVAVLPLLGVGGMQLFKAEVPGPTTDKLVPRVGETAKLLWKVYLLLSAILFLLLTGGGMDAFEAICHAMSTMATAGFSTRAASIGGFESAYFEWVFIVFMFIGGMNFTLHFMALRGRFRPYVRDPEWRVYTVLWVVAALTITFSLYHAPSGMSFSEALRKATFQSTSIMTTTGFTSADYELWTYAPMAIFVLIILMFVGGMAGSTSGGVKIVRHMLLVKLWFRELFFLAHPRAVRRVSLGKVAVAPEVIRALTAFMACYMALFVLGGAFFCLDGQDPFTAFSVSMASLGNVGPAFAEVGPSDNYELLSDTSKWVSAGLMIMGRLEIFTVLILFTRSFWQR